MSYEDIETLAGQSAESRAEGLEGGIFLAMSFTSSKVKGECLKGNMLYYAFALMLR